jgi:hypothetical protein
MNTLDRVARSGLKQSGAVHDGVDAANMLKPVIGRRCICNIQADPSGIRPAALQTRNIAGDACYLVTTGKEFGKNCAPDETGRSSYEHPHDSSCTL